MPERTRVQLHVGRLTLTRSLQECLVRIEKAALEREQLGFIMFVWNRHPQGLFLLRQKAKQGGERISVPTTYIVEGKNRLPEVL